ncbi:MAG: succinylglutamate desuccinylase/aspartoacylase family protein [Candidatus Micrarchaeota archaeon]|nr:succinylglutamate desuccinylase/aspartoacylase family protein [Candidatus Micrarchaeota archaeon]
MKTIEFGEGRKKVAIVGSLHGNELIGKQVIEMLSKEKNLGARIKGIIANEAAIKINKRFVDVDGNRCFPGKRNGNTEERMAFEVLHELEGYRYVIDIHSTYAKMPDTIIITKRRALGLARKVPIKKLVMMSRSIAKGKAIDDFPHECISIEFNRDTDANHVIKLVKATIRNIIEGKEAAVSKDSYVVKGVLGNTGKASGIENYRLVKEGDPVAVNNGELIRSRKRFYPIFIGEKGYKNVVCMMAFKSARMS